VPRWLCGARTLDKRGCHRRPRDARRGLPVLTTGMVSDVLLALLQPLTTWNPRATERHGPNHHDKQHTEAHGAQAPRARSGSRRWATIGGDRGRTKLERPANGLRRGQGGPVRSEPPFRLSDANLRLGAEPLIEMTTPPWVPTHDQDGHRPGPASR